MPTRQSDADDLKDMLKNLRNRGEFTEYEKDYCRGLLEAILENEY